ncbi:MAG: hypothetical protein Q9202_007306 [Teloschistes flavicans]
MSANQDLHTSPHTSSDRLTSEDPSVNPYEHNLSQSDTRQRTLDCPKHATFRRLWKEEYNQYVKSKPKGSLPSLFDLEMMASSNVEPTEPSANPAWVRSRLQAYGLVQGDDAALKRHPEVLKAAMAVINKPRDSFPNTNDVEMFQAKLKTYENSNEDTLLLQILPFYIREARWVPASSSGPLEPAIFRYVLIEQPADSPQSNKSDVEKVAEQASLTESEDRVSVSFFKSGMLEFANRNFSQPIPFFSDETVKLDRNVNKAMEKDAKMTCPRPDRTFGVNPMKITWPSGFTMPRELQLLMEVVRSCYYIFLIVEGKSSGGNISVARNQACRGGAISIYMERSLRVKLDIPEKPGADLTTMMFSVVITDQVVEIWIHWAEVHGPNPKDLSEPLQRPTYHMHCVFVEVLQKVGPIRRAIHNILDWGVGERF